MESHFQLLVYWYGKCRRLILVNSSFCSVNRGWVQRTEELHLLASSSEQEDLPQSNQRYSTSVKYLKSSGQPQPLKRACQTHLDLDANHTDFVLNYSANLLHRLDLLLLRQKQGGRIYFGLCFQSSVHGPYLSLPEAKGETEHDGGRNMWPKMESRDGVGRYQGLGIIFKGTPPVTCVFQRGPPPKFSTIFKRVSSPRD